MSLCRSREPIVATLPNDLAPLFFFFLVFATGAVEEVTTPCIAASPSLSERRDIAAWFLVFSTYCGCMNPVYLGGTRTIGSLVCRPSLYCFSSMPSKARRRGHVGARHVMWAVLVSNAVVGVGSPGIPLCSLRYESSPVGAVPVPLLLLVFRSRVWARVVT